jgi:hypothetical protein
VERLDSLDELLEPLGRLRPDEDPIVLKSRHLESLTFFRTNPVELGDDVRVRGFPPEIGEGFRELLGSPHGERPEDPRELEIDLAGEAREGGAKPAPEPLRLGAAQSTRPSVLEPGEREEEREEQQRENESKTAPHVFILVEGLSGTPLVLHS